MEHITDERLRHMRGVAELMYETAIANGCSETFARSMYLLGFLHDIGYAFQETDSEYHGLVGAKMLDDVGYPYAAEVEYHGDPRVEYKSDELNLLNWADLQVSWDGHRTSVESRIERSVEKYGMSSDIALNKLGLAIQLGLIQSEV